mmetsp:Transcript_12531/g.27671  ORF Transcript_12531/g.27671 Transcript_12531/m.27671 type:complete len:349 (-) Transcript_12531:330-1376(-)
MLAAGFTLGFPVAYCVEMVSQIFILVCGDIGYYLLIFIFGEDFLYFHADHLLLFDIFNQLIQSFVIAALTEELVKFYIFRTVEHPDLNQEVWLANGRPNRDLETPGSLESSGAPASLGMGRTDTRTIRGRAASITIAMICVALGFACAENLCYVFQSGITGNAAQQFLVLFVRALLPVHALAAAIQSVGVVQRDVEGHASLKVGKIVMPAVLFHGLFDACILVCTSIEDSIGVSIELILISLVVTVATMVLGLMYYIRTSKNQLTRLLLMEQMEQTTTFSPGSSGTGTGDWSSPRRSSRERGHSDSHSRSSRHLEKYQPPTQSETGTTFESTTLGSTESEYDEKMFPA